VPTESAFRLSTYLTLATACACLGYAESFLPEVRLFAVAAIVALAVIYRLETRVGLLSITDANKLGAALMLTWGGWAAYRIVREIYESEFPWMGWQLLMVALFGPLLMFLMPAKLARRQKHVGDYWSLQAMGLAVVALSGAMAEDEVCFSLIALYATCGVWSLTLFFLARSTGVVPPIPSRHATAAPADAPARAVASARPRSGTRELGRGLLWLGGAILAVLPLYLLTPRSSAGTLSFGQPRIEVGYAADQMIDLNKVGNLQSNPDPAFEVIAQTDDGRPKDDLSQTQRWRGVTLVDYRRGAWDREPSLRLLERTASLAQPWFPPDLGPDRYRLTFTVPLQVLRNGRPLLADPVVWVPGRPAPVASQEPDRPPVSWYPNEDGTFGPVDQIGGAPRRGGQARRSLRYVQVTRTQPDPDLGTGFELSRNIRDGLSRLTENPVPKVKEYADGVLARLVREGRLPAGAREQQGVKLARREEYHEAIAREFARFLATDAGLTYSLQLRRDRKDLDPVEEFLFHTKSGHCERFASALVLMLRSQRIPAAVVLGFRGCDSMGDGRYIVRQEYAHAWAQVLISRPTPDGTGRLWHWLSVDPTPSGSEESGAGGWLGDMLGTGWSLIDQYILHYSPEQRQKALDTMRDTLTRPNVLVGVGLGLVLVVAGRRLRRRSAALASSPSEPARWFGQLLSLLAAHGFAPQPGQTAREFAAAVAETLRDRPRAADLAGVPVEWAEAYYAARFGDVPVAPDRKAELEHRLSDLRRALGG
jgi:transglutaminase-like putative cysteine protease